MPVYVHLLIFTVLILLVLALILHFIEQEKLLAKKLLRGFGRLPVLEKCLIVGLLVAATAIGGSKNDSTNTPPLTGMFWFPQTSQQTAITESETNLGYRVVADDSAFGFAEPSQGAVTNEACRLCGGVTSAFRLVPDNWYFPFRETGATGLTVIARGELRPDIRTHFFPPAFDAPLAFLPLKNQSLLPEGIVSCFWHEQTASNSLILTWQNALYNRDVNCLTNFQAELFADGSFVYRYPDHAVSYVPVFPFDWDGDGLENSVDPEPLVAGPDAHGTNAEWYNTVCSNVFSAVEGMDGVVLSPRTEAVNTNAYYFVDVVVEHGPAPVYFTADRESDLGNPILIALSGVTNHVPLLIGLDYTVTSTVPFTVVSTNDLLELSCDSSSCQSRVKWPVSFSFESFGTGGYQVAVTPSWLAGTFSWTDGCCIASSSNVVAFTCSGQYSCLGCTAGGLYSYCGTALPFAGGSCGCTGQGAEHSGTNSVVPDLSVSLNLDHDVILFESAYTNRPGEIVSRQSTFTRVELTYGNSSSSAASVGFQVPQGAGRIILHEDNTNGTIVTEWSTNVVAGTSGSKLFFAEGVSKSAVVGDVGLRAMIAGSAGMCVANRNLTATEVWLEAEALMPQNRRRHLYGVGEVVNCRHVPLSVPIVWTSSIEGSLNQRSGYTFLDCPLTTNDLFHLFSQYGTIRISHAIDLLEPICLCATNVTAIDWQLPNGTAGGVGMEMDVNILPDYVSFQELAFCEVPSFTGIHTGYFDNEEWTNIWYHTVACGAGAWHDVQPHNFFMRDRAYMGDVLPELDVDGILVDGHANGWTNGCLSWSIPIGWRERGGHDVGEQALKCLPKTYSQIFELTSDGTLSVWKFDYEVSRTTNNCWSLSRRQKDVP